MEILKWVGLAAVAFLVLSWLRARGSVSVLPGAPLGMNGQPPAGFWGGYNFGGGYPPMYPPYKMATPISASYDAGDNSFSFNYGS
jgi:hypothetical protein